MVPGRAVLGCLLLPCSLYETTEYTARNPGPAREAS